MQTKAKTKEAPKRHEPLPVEVEHCQNPRGKLARQVRGRLMPGPRTGAGLLYEADMDDFGKDNLYDETPSMGFLASLLQDETDSGPADGDDRLHHLAMVNGQAQPLLRRPQPKPAPRMPAVRPGSRLACERRCGGAGCDPTNSHGCGGVFCLDGAEQL
ncbi:hypothetical protein [Pseudoduganella violacea]|uniref:Uncharacterized protein n=1 Tax=Pseudoduganella violacea TaxID=1715466 RepID=A0A7W5BEZ9_9BURK|nr:hypothetical protein [Pseudoduganella violacea]MBB3121936.1 hypothetical protein [Pseudoduganella violacea]